MMDTKPLPVYPADSYNTRTQDSIFYKVIDGEIDYSKPLTYHKVAYNLNKKLTKLMPAELLYNLEYLSLCNWELTNQNFPSVWHYIVAFPIYDPHDHRYLINVALNKRGNKYAVIFRMVLWSDKSKDANAVCAVINDQ